jgi:hypothetical protein
MRVSDIHYLAPPERKRTTYLQTLGEQSRVLPNCILNLFDRIVAHKTKAGPMGMFRMCRQLAGCPARSRKRKLDTHHLLGKAPLIS